MMYNSDGNEILILRKSAKSGFQFSDFRLENPDSGFFNLKIGDLSLLLQIFVF
jgi:hypothetical protein